MSYYERNLPHWQPEGKHLFVTWRLHGSLPLNVLQGLRDENEPERGKAFLRFDSVLDRAAFGPHWLCDERIAAIVRQEILGIGQRGWGVMHSWVVMPNHVHLLVEPKIVLKRIMQAIKGRSARSCNQVLRRRGLPFWQQESFDHWVRSTTSFARISAYIERNPVAAGLVKHPADWPWSSAHK